MSKRSLFYTLSFAVGGFLLALWDLEFNFDPLPWGELRYFLREACFEVSAIRWWGGTRHLLLLWPLGTAGVYGLMGFVVGRALRRLPSPGDDPRGHRLVRRLVLYFSAVGYILPVWFEGLNFAPFRWELAMNLLFDSCLVCVHTSPRSSSWVVLLLPGPVNAAIYAGLGWVIGRAFRRGGSLHDIE